MDRQTQKNLLLEMFLNHGNKLRLKDILAVPHLAGSYRQRISDLRDDDYTVLCLPDDEHPGDTVYVLRQPTRSNRPLYNQANLF
jgi:hypothetical protein